MGSETDHTHYYESLIDMFATEGWRAFIEDMEAGVEHDVNFDKCEDADEFWKTKGKKEVYDKLTNYEDFIRKGFEAYEDAKTL